MLRCKKSPSKQAHKLIGAVATDIASNENLSPLSKGYTTTLDTPAHAGLAPRSRCFDSRVVPAIGTVLQFHTTSARTKPVKTDRRHHAIVQLETYETAGQQV